MGAITRKFKPDGFLYYSMGLWRNPRPMTDGPFTDWIVRNREWYHGDGCITYCAPDGTPIASQHLENFRDGLEDLWYAKLLEEKLRKNMDASWAQRAQEALAVPPDVVKSLSAYTVDPAVVNRWRDEMADLIEL